MSEVEDKKTLMEEIKSVQESIDKIKKGILVVDENSEPSEDDLNAKTISQVQEHSGRARVSLQIIAQKYSDALAYLLMDVKREGKYKPPAASTKECILTLLIRDMINVSHQIAIYGRYFNRLCLDIHTLGLSSSKNIEDDEQESFVKMHKNLDKMIYEIARDSIELHCKTRSDYRMKLHDLAKELDNGYGIIMQCYEYVNKYKLPNLQQEVEDKK